MTDETTTADELVIERIFDAPRELVWRAFTDPDELCRWFGPVGFSVPRDSVEIDPRPGGVNRYVMVSDDDPSRTSPVNSVFLEVVEHELLVGEETWEGVRGMQDGGTMRIRIEFHAEPGDRTRLVIRQGPFPAQMGDMAGKGWENSFTKLDAVLAG